MKMRLLIPFAMLCITAAGLPAQAPKVYLNFVSHNEPADNLQQSAAFQATVPWLDSLIQLMENTGARWNFQTCDGFVDGVLTHDAGATNAADILNRLDQSPNVEVDPRYKSYLNFPNQRNVADIVHLIDSCGVTASNVLGGFLWYNQGGSPDWMPFENDTIWGIQYPAAWWRCDFLWGAGSAPPHQNDFNNWGVWQPDSYANFGGHNSSRHVWYIGNGCAPYVEDSNDYDPISFFNTIRSQVDSVQNGYWDQSGFYTMSITINQNQFGPMFLQKTRQLIDSLNTIGSDKLEWAMLSEKWTAFQAWQANASSYSQWECGQAPVSVAPAHAEPSLLLFPNPVQDRLRLRSAADGVIPVRILNAEGQVLHEMELRSECTLEVGHWPAGLYVVLADGLALKWVKN